MRLDLNSHLFWSCMSMYADGPRTYMINTTDWNSQSPRYHSICTTDRTKRKERYKADAKKVQDSPRYKRDVGRCIAVLTYPQRVVQIHRKKALTLSIRQQMISRVCIPRS